MRAWRTDFWRRVARAALPYALCGGVLLAYVCSPWSPLGVRATQLWTEAPLVLYLYALLRWPLRAGRTRAWLAALPLCWLYVVHDEYVRRWGDVPNLSDVAMLGDLFEVVGAAPFVMLVLLLVAPFVAWGAGLDRSRAWLTRRASLGGLPLSFVVVYLAVAPGHAYETLNGLTEDAEWSDRRNAEQWGRLYATMFREVRSASFAEGLSGFTPLARSALPVPREWLTSRARPRNVHILVLESFVDVRLLSRVTFSEPPFDPAFAAWIDPFTSTSVSPVYGGETARAEFEVLCGVPSLRIYGVEFLGFSGARTYCLPSILRDAGYYTMLTFPHGPVFFNTRRAYPGLGFEQRVYGDEFAPPGAPSIAMHDVSYVEDSDLLPQNLAMVRELVARGRPFLNYVMSIYGHWPFDIDESRYPQLIGVTPEISDLAKIATQTRHRSAALAAYLRELTALDPSSVIVLVADHLPPLPDGMDQYDTLGYRAAGQGAKAPIEERAFETFLLVFKDGKPIKLPRMRHFDLPHWVLNELSAGRYCAEKRCELGAVPLARKRYLDAYETILGLASRPPRATPGAGSDGP